MVRWAEVSRSTDFGALRLGLPVCRWGLGCSGIFTGNRGLWSRAKPGVHPNSGNVPPQPRIRYCWMIARIVAEDPVEEQAGRQERAPQDRDERQEVGHLPLDADVGVVVRGGRVGRRQRHPRLHELEQRRDDGQDADPEAGDEQPEQLTCSGGPSHARTAIGSRHGLATWPAALKIGCRIALEPGQDLQPEDVEHRVHVVVREALADDRVDRDQQAEREEQRQAARRPG